MAHGDGGSAELVAEFRTAVDDCRAIYQAAVEDVLRFHPERAAGGATEFHAGMMDLHRGLVVKVFLTIAQADWRWTSPERALATELFEQLWGRRLEGDELQEALAHAISRDTKLKWTALVRPFESLPPFRHRSADLLAAVARLGTIVAKADGIIRPDETRLIEHVRQELERLLVGLPADAAAGNATRGDSPRGARVATAAENVREAYELPAVKVQPLPQKGRDELLADALAELDALVGIDKVKLEVRTLVNYLKMQAQREQYGLPATTMSLHMVFGGNPGTGKTTVARIVGRLLGAMGILAKGHLVECDRGGLVAAYAGQTAPKTSKTIDSALDGVLFIDEAYSLVAEEGDDPFGAEAVQTLLKRMEDDRHRLVVVLAGYPEPMERLLASNPGLSSRFSRRFEFPDYTAAELGRIFQAFCQQNHYSLPAATRARLLVGFGRLLADRDEHFGNGRLARNVFEHALRRLANRIATATPVTRELLSTLEAGDIEFEGLPAEAWVQLEDPKLRFGVPCPSCRQASRLQAEHLGRRVRCKKCEHSFVAEWGDPL
jgi:AAA+ superfamily predicted ATPase